MKSEGITGGGNRRSGIDRREFSYTAHFPERRSEKDRRRKPDLVVLRIIKAKATRKIKNIMAV